MSLDTVQRIDTFFADNVATPNNIFTIYEDKNEGLFEGGSGPFCKIWTEAGLDDVVAIQSQNNICYKESGLIIIQIFMQKGLGTIDTYGLSRVATLIRNAFRGVFLAPTGGQEGEIYFKDITISQTVEIPAQVFERSGFFSNGGDIPWKRKDIFINYRKDY